MDAKQEFREKLTTLFEEYHNEFEDVSEVMKICEGTIAEFC